jgi:porin
MALNFNPILVTTVPYSTLGAGMIILPTKDPKGAVVSLSVVSSTGFANTTGFTDLSANKLTFAGEARVRTDFFGKTGHQLVGYTYSNKEFTSLDQRLGAFLETRETLKKKGSWAFYYNFDQYVYEPSKGSGKGLGIFGRFGASDGNPNPANYFFSLGIGGKGIMVSRPNDRFGIGWYYIDVANLNVTTPFGVREFLRDEQGFEAYYGLALTPWAHLSPNVQYVHTAQRNTLRGESVDDATILGIRLLLVF